MRSHVRTWQHLWVAEEMAAQSLQDLSPRTGVWCVCTPWALQLQLAHANDASLSGILLWCFWGHVFPAIWAELCAVLTQDQKLHHHFMQPKESSPVWTFSKALTASDWHIRGLKNLPSLFPWEQNLPSLFCKHLSIVLSGMPAQLNSF